MPKNPWTFQRLTSLSLDLVRRYPLLVLPVVIADLLGFTAMHVQHALHQPLFDFFLTEHRSVLSTSHESFQLTLANYRKAALLSAPLLWGTYFLNVCFYAAAMLSVSDLVEARWSNHPIHLRQVRASLIAKKRDLLIFSLFFMGLLVVAAVITYFLFMAVGSTPWLAQKISFDTGVIIGLVASIPVVYFGSYRALDLIGHADTPLDIGKLQLARLCAFATVALQNTIVLLIRHLAPDSFYQQRTVPGLLLRQASESLIGAFPFVLLFIAFSILKSKEPNQPDGSFPSPTIPNLGE